MTELTITPKVSDKTARFKGTIAAGEHVAVTIKGGAEWIGEDEGANLTLRVIDLVTKRTLAVFPRPPEVMDEGAEPDAWGSSGDDLICTLNLNSDRMVAAARHMLRVPVMFVLGDTDAPRTLYFCDRYTVEYWPERIGDDVPYDLDAWPKQIDEWMELVDEWTEQMSEFGETLSGHVGNIGIHVTAEQKAAWTAKQNAIADLDAIRAGAAKGATAIQSHQDISGKADLVGGKVPQSQLPSYVDDVLEFAAAANFPATGEEGKIYVAKDENKTYRWSGTQYVPIGGSDMTVDPALDNTSTNPVQNKVVTAAVNEKCTVAEAVAEVTRLGDWEWTGPGTYIASASELPAEGSFDGETYFTVSDITWVDATPGSEHWDAFITMWQWIVEGGEWTWATNSGFGQDSSHGKDSDEITFDVNFQAGDLTFTARRKNAHGLARLVDLPTATSQLQNDGADGAHPFISQDEVQHQQLALRGPNHDGYSAWTIKRDGVDVTSQVAEQPSYFALSLGWDISGSVIAGDEILGTGIVEADQYARSLSWEAAIAEGEDVGMSVSYTATRTVLAGYVLEGQTDKPLQPQGDYAPATNIPKSALASDVQTSLGLADTAVQPAEIAAKMPMYALGATPMVSQSVSVLAACFPIVYTLYGESSSVTVAAADAGDLGIALVEVGGGIVLYSVNHNGHVIFLASDQGVFADALGNTITFDGNTPTVDSTHVLDIKNILTVAPYTVATYTATSTAAAFEIAVGALPTGVTGKLRDCELVIDCTATGAVAPTVTWGAHFHPRTDTETDLAIVEAGKRAVFYISEYAPGEFAVGGWKETTGGNT